MAVDKLVDSIQLDSDLTSVANAIRTRGGTSSQLTFPSGFVSSVEAIGNSYSQSDEGKVVSNGALVAQTAHADVTPTTSDQTIDTTTNDSIKVKGDADLVASNIKKDVEIFGVTGSYEGGGGGISVDGIAQKIEPSGDITLNVPLTSGYNAAGIRGYAFYDNTTITGITLLTDPNVYNYAFANMKGLVSFSAPICTGFGNKGISTSQYIFDGCSALQSVNIPLMTSLGGYAFRGCTSLQKIVMPSVTGNNLGGNGTFSGCSALTVADFKAPTKLGNVDFFANCSSLTTVILRTSSVCTLNQINNIASGTPFASDGTGGTLYVPSALISDYQAATNWSTVLGYTNNSIAAIEGSQYENYYADGTPISA